jgi:DNA repair exonuclease SbcCD nuclease subunit
MNKKKWSDKKIAHLADIQIRKAVRHDEYTQVFERTYNDLKQEKPFRILLVGDIFHNKVDLSPNLITLASEFFVKLSEIAPVDIFPGNHDLNLSQLTQGDSIKSIVLLLSNGIVVKHDNQIDYQQKFDNKHGIFYFPESGYYDIGSDIIYGNYSCIDGEILSLKNKDEDKKYIALYHGMVYQSMSDNGMINGDPSLLKVSAFKGFDIVAMGDIHEQQDFERFEEMYIDESELAKYEKEGWQVS